MLLGGAKNALSALLAMGKAGGRNSVVTARQEFLLEKHADAARGGRIKLKKYAELCDVTIRVAVLHRDGKRINMKTAGRNEGEREGGAMV